MTALRVETRLYNVCIYIYILGSKNLPLLLLRLLSKQCLIGCLGSLNICISFLYGLSCISSSNSLAGKGLVDGWSSMTSNSPEQPPCRKQQSSMTSNSPEQPLCRKQQLSTTSNSPEQPLCQKQQTLCASLSVTFLVSATTPGGSRLCWRRKRPALRADWRKGACEHVD